MDKSEYWTKYWQDYARMADELDEQTQVLRTCNRVPVSEEVWMKTLDMMSEHLDLSEEDEVLELCCGNGLISRHLASKCRSVTSVDVAQGLIDNLGKYKLENVKTIVEDIRNVNFADSSFTKIVMYAGIQYLTHGESVSLVKKAFNWLGQGGIFYIGDIPDVNRLWNFYDTPERAGLYLENLISGEPIIGTWYDSVFMDKLGAHVGFSASRLIPQHEDFINSYCRYDYKYIK